MLENQYPKIEFHAESSDRELLGRPVARYSTVFVFYVGVTGRGGWGHIRDLAGISREMMGYCKPAS